MTDSQQKVALAQAIAQAMDQSDAQKQISPAFNSDVQTYLKEVTFADPLNLIHPRYFDKIKNVDRNEIERFYLDYTGRVTRSEVLKLPRDQFWQPLNLLAEYYMRFGKMPVSTNVSIPMLKGALGQHRRAEAKESSKGHAKESSKGHAKQFQGSRLFIMQCGDGAGGQ